MKFLKEFPPVPQLPQGCCWWWKWWKLVDGAHKVGFAPQQRAFQLYFANYPIIFCLLPNGISAVGK